MAEGIAVVSRRLRHTRFRTPGRALALSTLSLVALTSCATLGGNIKGSFSCAAPDGMCAPSSKIDDQALAMIAGDASDGSISPAGPYEEGKPRARVYRTAAAEPGRTREKVLRIVFPSYIDDRGRLHEATAIHAVVETGQWQQAMATAMVVPDRAALAAAAGIESLAEAVDPADPPTVSVTAADPDMPDPAAVAAARARNADPIGAIKADVAGRLTTRRPRRSAATAPAATPAPVPLRTVRATSNPGAPATPAKAVQQPGAKLPPTTSGAAAIAHVKSNRGYQEAANHMARSAADASAPATLPAAAPPKGARPRSTVRAAGFPGTAGEQR